MKPTQYKAYAYLVRQHGTLGPQLLVFRHPKPEAGIQIPKGTIEQGECAAEAVLRELGEEAGVERVGRVRLVGVDRWWWQEKERWVVRHFFAMEPHPWHPLGDGWTHEVTGEGEEQGMAFEYFWIPLAQAQHTLIAQMGQWAAKAGPWGRGLEGW